MRNRDKNRNEKIYWNRSRKFIFFVMRVEIGNGNGD